jgi:hypothetical protein
MLSTWQEINYLPGDTDTSAKVIWNNANILINNKSVFSPDFFSRSVIYISDIFNNEGKIKNWNNLKHMGCTPAQLLKWRGIVSAIPSKWKCEQPRVVRPIPSISITIKDAVIPLAGCNTSKIRNCFTEHKFIPPVCKFYFQQLFNIDESEWKFIFSLPLFASLDSKLQEFQWKLSHNIVYTNFTLHRMKSQKVQSSLCTFCNEMDETILHLFVHCNTVKSLWRSFHNQWGYQLNAPSTLTGKQILLGDQSFSLLLNHLIILVKKYIYDSKLVKIPPKFDIIKIKTTHTKTIEKFIAERGNTMDKFLKKWGSFNI